MPPHPQRNSRGSSKSLKIKGKSYQIRKQKINRLLSKIEENSLQHHSEHLKVALLSTILTKINIKHIISIADHEPNFLDMFRETEDQVNDWRHATEYQIDDLLIKASKEISERKAATQSGFKKLAYPHFNGDVLNYLELNKRWAAEVVPERKPPATELVALRDSIPATAKAKIADVTTMVKAWKLLDLEYGNLQELRAKLKDQV